VKEASWEADWEPFDNSLKAPKYSLHEVLIGIGDPRSLFDYRYIFEFALKNRPQEGQPVRKHVMDLK
jgi:hypothetical protein